MKFTIYCIMNIKTGKRYIGQTRQDPGFRWVQHVSDARTGHGRTYFHRAVQKYGRESFELVALEEGIPTIQEANAAERQWIRHFQSNDHRYGYNLTDGGWASTPNSETRQRQSAAQKKRFAQPGARERLSAQVKAAHPGVSARNRSKLSDTHRGHTRNRGLVLGPLSEEHRAKIAASKSGRSVTHRYGVQQLDADGISIAEFPSLTAAARVIGCAPATIGRCARGQVPTVGGFKWRFSVEPSPTNLLIGGRVARDVDG